MLKGRNVVWVKLGILSIVRSVIFQIYWKRFGTHNGRYQFINKRYCIAASIMPTERFVIVWDAYKQYMYAISGGSMA